MRLLSLCSGIGGIELGLETVQSFRLVGFAERDTFCRWVLKSRWPGIPIFSDISETSVECDMITAGFPCQPWSAAGKRKGIEDERWIWPVISSCIRRSGARRVFLENTPGLVSGGGLPIILWDLAKMGFDAEWGLFSCRSLGAPHHRQRLFLLADSNPQGRKIEGRPKGEGQPDTSRCIGMLAHSNCGQSESRMEPKRQSQNAPNHRSTFWPPGPTGDWAGLTPWPSEPGFCRVAHGSSRGVDRPSYTARIRALGNSVSPPVAAVAYTELSRRLLT